MARVMITCPVTGMVVFTGMDLPKKEFEAADIRDEIVKCPHCSQTHTWQKEDAYLVGE